MPDNDAAGLASEPAFAQGAFPQEDGSDPSTRSGADNLAYIMYTSGSTGKPKGVFHTQGGYLTYTAHTCQWVFDLKDDDELVLGLGLGCGGAVHLLLQRLVPANDFAPLGPLFDRLAAGLRVDGVDVLAARLVGPDEGQETAARRDGIDRHPGGYVGRGAGPPSA